MSATGSAVGSPTIAPPRTRVVDFVVVKRNLALAGRSYGHWWVELDGIESYGWWPARSPLRTRDVFLGGPGVLNGVEADTDQALPRDPNHGLVADYEFHPVLVLPRTDDEVRTAIRLFATTFRGEWRWSVRPTMNCRLFNLMLLDAAGLVDGTGNYRSRGAGCPVLAPLRRMAGRITAQRYWPRNLPLPGQRVADALGECTRVPTAQPLVRPIALGSS